MSQTPFPPPPPYGKPGDAKAAAKAAKAYAKATRPWYRKKRWWALGAAALVVIASMSANSGTGDTGDPLAGESLKPIPRSSGSAQPAQADADGKRVFHVGEPVTLEGTRYTVTGASMQHNIGGAYGEKADGVFVVVDLTIENTKDETKTFMDDAATFIARDGTKYEGSDAAMYLGDDSLFLRDMQPDLPTRGKLVFDVPSTKAAAGILRVADLFGRGEARIDLGLK